jgi:hypothetical protein
LKRGWTLGAFIEHQLSVDRALPGLKIQQVHGSVVAFAAMAKEHLDVLSRNQPAIERDGVVG